MEKKPISNVLAGLLLGFILFVVYTLMNGCYVEEVNIYNGAMDDNRSSQLIIPSEKEEGKKGQGLDQS
jgi:hypothetical protein